MDSASVLGEVKRIADGFATDRHNRQRRRELVASDFDALHKAGFYLTGVPVEAGGLFESVAKSTRPVGEMLRTLARGDPSVALVMSMHPAVLSFWLGDARGARTASRRVGRAARIRVSHGSEGAQFGTITSEPGSGGDVPAPRRSRARAGPTGPGC